MSRRAGRRTPLPTTDPFTGEELVVTRLVNPRSGLVLEGEFSLGWLSRLTQEQLEFVGVLLGRRNNLQRLASDLGIAYNTARNRFEDIVRMLGAPADTDAPIAEAAAPDEDGDDLGRRARRRAVLQRLAAGEVDMEEARALLSALSPDPTSAPATEDPPERE